MKIRNLMLIAFIIPAMIVLSGCGGKRRTSADLSRLSVGMTRERVREVIGEPDEVRGSTVDKEGNVISLWSYDVYRQGR
jgi:outer membrane protein assembly factor BamE (lipoprotein component of BamABCDE complex)